MTDAVLSGDRFRGALSFLCTFNVEEIPHVNSDLLSHLKGTATLLSSWESTEDLRLAGLCHAAYGTDGFSQSLLGVAERQILREVVGEHTEATIYRYASCDRSAFYPRVGTTYRPLFRDRFTGTDSQLSSPELRDFLELTFANELELAFGNARFVSQTRTFFRDLFPRCRPYVSEAAFGTFEEIFGDI